MTTIVREWTLLEEIGRGGMGVVYRATHEMLPGEFAVKEIKPELARDGEIRERFLREATTAHSLSHPNVVKTHVPFREGEHLYLPMEMLRGCALSERMEQEPGPWEMKRAVRIARDAAAGLGHAHAHGVLHRDVKPGNLFVLPDGSVKVLDFGLAKGLSQATMTATGMMPGTPVYMAPEALHGKKSTAAVDVYALGMVLFRLVAGRMAIDMPEDDSSILALVMAVGQAHASPQGLPKASQFRPDVPPWLDELIASMLETDPDKRPQSGDGVVERLATGGAGSTVSPALPSIQREPGTKPGRKDPTPEYETRFQVPTLQRESQQGQTTKENRQTPPSVSRPQTAFEPNTPEKQVMVSSTVSKASKSRLPVVAVVAVVSALAIVAIPAGWWLTVEYPKQRETTACASARQSDSKDAWQSYLAAHADGTCAAEAQRRLQAIEKDTAACAAAKTADTEAAWSEYMTQHPDGHCRTLATTRQAELRAAAEQKDREKKEAARRAEEHQKQLAAQKAEEAKKRRKEQRRKGMVHVPAGEFFMGCNTRVDSSCSNDEKPGHTVHVDAFDIDKTEVTVAQYGACVKAGRCSKPGTDNEYCNWGKSDRANHPINCVDWNQAKAYCAWTKKRLPTEAEWEKAARGTDGRKYPWGNQTASCRYAVMDDKKTRGSAGSVTDGCGEDRTWPVGSKTAGASPYGALDMAGNVWEWVQDWYHKSYNGAPTDGSAWEAGGGSGRVRRGGGWYGNAGDLRAANRSSNSPGYGNYGLGFRCARSP